MSQTPRWQRKLARRLTAKYRARPPQDIESPADRRAYAEHANRCRPLRPHPDSPYANHQE